ncbi:MAG TPA: sensor histidine kinase [Acidimicrobiia bacterium]|nr:sensor histidine kinase [Acidimicrobiia bacterium]
MALAVTLPWRRTRPLTVVVIVFAAITVMNVVALITSDPDVGLYTMAFILIIPYALLRWGSGREIIIGLGLVLLGFGTGLAADFTDVGEAVAGFIFAMSPALIGATVRYRSFARDRDRDRAVLQERAELARELHDTVAHHVSAIAIRAQAGRTLAGTNPNAPLEALQVIEEEASKTLAEMRAMVGALRSGEEPELRPVPGIADIERLARDTVEGPELSVSISGDLDGIAPAVDAAIYRLAQESITNALRHARHATTIEVAVSGEGKSARVTVHDDGEPRHIGSPEPGFGLIGMRERVKLLGGSLETGPGPVRGWVVSAVLPKDGSPR